jgi:hypothetical protein
MEKLKAAYIGAVGILIILIIAIIYKGSTVLSPTVELTSKQEFVNIGEEIVADFRIYNPYREPKNYRYLLYYNGTKRFNNTVLINPKSSFQFGGHYRATSTGVVEITALVYDGNELVSNTTYHVIVQGN